MKTNSREFEIAWQGLKPGLHQYTYDIGERFFDNGVELDFSEPDLHVRLNFNKENGFFLLEFQVTGSVLLPCDRCGDLFRMEIWDEFKLLVKLADLEKNEQQEPDADVVFISRAETVLDVREWVYEYVILSIPLQRLHPNLQNGQPGCNAEALKYLNNISVAEDDSAESDIWKDLKDLKIKTERKSKKS